MAAGTSVLVSFRGLGKSFGDKSVLNNLSLDIYDGEFVTLLGPSGCGKTTLLRMLGGFDQPDSGDIMLAGQSLQKLPPHLRPVNTVFQSYALFPHMSVFDNVAYGLRMGGCAKSEINARVQQVLHMVRLQDFADRRPHQLSGGQQQRVAIARAVVKKPRVLLLDEPLSALDYKLRKEMQLELKRLQRELGITFLFVTHDQEEALSMSDRVVVMQQGRIEQTGTPREVYETPATLFVARFVGETNLFTGVIEEILPDDRLIATLAGRCCTLRSRGRSFHVGQPIHVMLRPEDMRLGEPGQAEGWEGQILERNYKGMTLESLVQLDNGQQVLASEFFDESYPDFDHGLGERVVVNWVPEWEWIIADEKP